MGATALLARLRAPTLAVLLLGISFAPALAEEYRSGDQLWVSSGASIELEGLDKQLYDAPSGTLLLVKVVRRLTGRNGTFWVATLQDANGAVYRTLADNLSGKVTQSPELSAIEMPANVAHASSVILGGNYPACPPQTREFRPIEPAANPEKSPEKSKVDASDCVSTKKHPACTKTPCNLQPPSDSAMRRFYPLIVEALNSPEIAASNARARARGIAEIHPAMIASVIAAESSGRPLVTFTEKSGRKGKGIGQYTYFEKAWSANLDYNAKMPTEATVFETKVNTPYSLTYKGKTKQVYSVWSPKGVIVGMAADLTEILAEDRFITPRDSKGTPIRGAKPVEVSQIYKDSPVQAMRYLAGHHNRQDRVFQSIDEFYRQKGRLPSEYGEAWGAAPIKGTPNFKLLYGQCINRCYVEKIAGLCGEAQGYFGRYLKHFSQGSDGKWSVAG